MTDVSTSIMLVELEEKEEPLIKATDLSTRLGYKRNDAVSKIVNNRSEDFGDDEAFIIGNSLYLSETGALKICMFSDTSIARDVRNEVIAVYQNWRKSLFKSIVPNISKAQQALLMAQALVEFEERLKLTEDELSNQREVIENSTERIHKIEDTLKLSGIITDEQAEIIRESVSAVAFVINETKPQYGKVYGSFYKKFGITSYKLLPIAKYNEALDFLTAWYHRILSQS